MGVLFDDIVPQNKHLRIGNLTIDLGHIKFESLDRELVDQVIEKLEREISLLLLHDNTAAEDDAEQYPNDQSGSYVSLLEYFLLRGMLPWWAGSENSATPFLAFEFLLSQNPGALVRLIQRIGQKSYVRKRLVYQLSEEQIRSFISILEPAEAEFIFDYHAEVIRTQRQKQLIKNEETEFKKAVWEFIVTYLIVDRGSHFNRKEFVKNTLMSIAANFNVSYEGLLNLFATSIVPGSSNLKNVDSIQTIILEIAVEKGTRISQRSALDDILEIPVETPESGIDLLRYYLTFGSFPWWSINVAETELQTLTSVLMRKYPRTLESLIRSVGQREYSRKLIVKTFKEDALKDILKTIEPENAEFIIDYVQEVKATHSKMSVLKILTESLHEAIWEFIFEYLLVDRGSEFNRQVFLESNIKKLAGRYNLNFKDLLVFMVNNIAVTHSNSSRHLNLFQGLTSLYNQNIESSGLQHEIEGAQEPSDAASSRTVEKINLLDVLYFWIRNGHKPWWAGQYANISPSALLEQLIREAPLEAIIFLKHSGLQVKMRKRLVYQIPFQTIIKLFQLLPGGTDIVRYSANLLAVVRSSKTIKYSDQTITERILLFSLWEILASSSYQILKVVPFVSSVISNLALWFQIPVKKIISSFKIEHGDGIGDLDEVRRIINEAHLHIQQQNAITGSYDKELLEDWAESNSIEEVLGGLSLEGITSSQTDPGKEILQRALSVLVFFLQTGKLPDGFQSYSQSSVNSFLKELLLFLFRKMPSDLKSVLGSVEYRGEYFLRIHELFPVSNSIVESSVISLLQAHLEKNILLYIEQHGTLEHGQSIFSVIDNYIKDRSSQHSMQLLKQLLRYSSVSMQLAYHYKNEITYDLISSNFIQIGWGSQTGGFLKSFNSWLLDMVDDQLDRERLDLLFRTFNFIMIGGGVSAGSLRSYLNYLFKFLFERDYQLMLKVANLVNQIKPADPASDPVITSSINDIKLELQTYVSFKETSSELTRELIKSEASALKQLNSEIDVQKEAEKKFLEMETEQDQPEAAEEDKDLFSDKDKIYIKNSGLVILHPFLSTYFTRLQMLDKGDFINEEMRHRAVHLLQYLAFGTESNEEHELVLNKILCNIPVEEPVMISIEITEYEKTVSAELLNAVIAQWDKLKNSTAESLQASFIQREGALYKVEDTWNLKVEQRGYDVLLQTLPWGLGMVKTSWMTDFIIVEWT